MSCLSSVYSENLTFDKLFDTSSSVSYKWSKISNVHPTALRTPSAIHQSFHVCQQLAINVCVNLQWSQISFSVCEYILENASLHDSPALKSTTPLSGILAKVLLFCLILYVGTVGFCPQTAPFVQLQSMREGLVRLLVGSIRFFPSFPETTSKSYELISGHLRRRLTPGNLFAFAPRRLQIHSTQKKIFLKKATNISPLGVKKCALPNQKVHHLKSILFDMYR